MAVFLVRDGPRRLHGVGALLYGFVVDALHAVNFKGYVFDGVAMALKVVVDLSEELAFFGCDGFVFWEMFLRTERGCEDEADVAVSDNVGSEVTATCLKTAIC
jgi:hypothetical protein